MQEEHLHLTLSRHSNGKATPVHACMCVCAVCRHVCLCSYVYVYAHVCNDTRKVPCGLKQAGEKRVKEKGRGDERERDGEVSSFSP